MICPRCKKMKDFNVAFCPFGGVKLSSKEVKEEYEVDS